MSKSKNDNRDYIEDKFERRAKRSLRNSHQQTEDWKFDPRKDYSRDEWEEREKALERARLR